MKLKLISHIAKNCDCATQFMLRIDWALLREQKADLIGIIESLNGDSVSTRMDGYPNLADTMDKQIKSLDGIVNMIDALQDFAVDVLKVDSKIVFDLEE